MPDRPPQLSECRRGNERFCKKRLRSILPNRFGNEADVHSTFRKAISGKISTAFEPKFGLFRKKSADENTAA
jgi:hypothetical protein